MTTPPCSRAAPSSAGASFDVASPPMSVAFAAGALAGSVAATITLPFDVIKTRQQSLLGQFVDGEPDHSVSSAQRPTALLCSSRSNAPPPPPLTTHRPCPASVCNKHKAGKEDSKGVVVVHCEGGVQKLWPPRPLHGCVARNRAALALTFSLFSDNATAGCALLPAPPPPPHPAATSLGHRPHAENSQGGASLCHYDLHLRVLQAVFPRTQRSCARRQRSRVVAVLATASPLSFLSFPF